LEQAAKITDHVSRIVLPVFSLNRGVGCEIHKNAHWDLQTNLELRTRVLGASSTSRRVTGHHWVTPLATRFVALNRGEIREMYHRAVDKLLNEVAETEQFFREGIVVIDITEADPFTGDKTGREDKIIGTKEQTEEYAYQWATVQLGGNEVPIVLDARPVLRGELRLDIVEDLLDSAEEIVDGWFLFLYSL
jgi:hypothetical protein